MSHRLYKRRWPPPWRNSWVRITSYSSLIELGLTYREVLRGWLTFQFCAKTSGDTLNHPGVRAAVIAGLGFTISSRWMFEPELESGQVVPLLEDWRLPPENLWVIYPSGQLTSSKARAFIKWFERTLTQDASDRSGNQLERAASA